MVEKFEIFQTFMKRYNVDMGMLHEEADGPWLPGGELNNDWVSNVLAFVLNFFQLQLTYFKPFPNYNFLFQGDVGR